MSKPTVYLDAGHGGLTEDGYYTTGRRKLHKHEKGEFHGDGWFYEGVFNRIIAEGVAKELRLLGFEVIEVYKTEKDPQGILDRPLKDRVDQANEHFLSHGRYGVFISNHANASPRHNARGFEYYTSIGHTDADRFGAIYYNYQQELVGEYIRQRTDQSDGDPDKEANFYVLRKTLMPALLIEHGFFDQYDDAMLLMDEDIQEKFIKAQVYACVDYFYL
jgi:N-acetylmuramoyl-L-alanine amidase